jgi:hypothetical protein
LILPDQRSGTRCTKSEVRKFEDEVLVRRGLDTLLVAPRKKKCRLQTRANAIRISRDAAAAAKAIWRPWRGSGGPTTEAAAFRCPTEFFAYISRRNKHSRRGGTIHIILPRPGFVIKNRNVRIYFWRPSLLAVYGHQNIYIRYCYTHNTYRQPGLLCTSRNFAHI